MMKYILIFFTIASSSHLVWSQITNKLEAIDDFYTNYIPSNIDSVLLQWTGNAASCHAGTISATAKSKLLQRINYFRRMVGVEDQIIFSSALDDKCQQAALMMHANSQLSHLPPANWSCFTSVGAEAAGKSNLQGRASGIPIDNINPINSYVEDRGSGNEVVGHRRWLFNSKATEFGVGQTSRYNALWVLQNINNPSIYNNYIAYPPDGYIPNMLVYDRWSFSIPEADYSTATVIIKDSNNSNIPLSIVSNDAIGYADNTIVWEPASIITDSSEDVLYDVTINGVVLSNGTTRDYTYTTKIFNPIILGDVNLDGQLDIGDALQIARYSVGIGIIGNCNNLITGQLCLSNADVDNDLQINVGDALLIAQCTVGITNVLCPN